MLYWCHTKNEISKIDFAHNLSCFSTKKSDKSKIFPDNQLSQEDKISLTKIKASPLPQEQLSQPDLSIEFFILDLNV